ncbi:hypothetical protein JAAARDRAFT_198514 [Jaapia argillacea MUCL 33604]|uniref:Uncharacterized protein n=1 Tax=Jaapia argillacea MUCL 33604 TaxID=933084 RepID=A0A067PBF5_9AGAM|nr:hypothetical protein JAAARDRAFT_198514 [Jaapia argillacea MUCL 33604]
MAGGWTDRIGAHFYEDFWLVFFMTYTMSGVHEKAYQGHKGNITNWRALPTLSDNDFVRMISDKRKWHIVVPAPAQTILQHIIQAGAGFFLQA